VNIRDDVILSNQKKLEIMENKIYALAYKHHLLINPINPDASFLSLLKYFIPYDSKI